MLSIHNRGCFDKTLHIMMLRLLSTACALLLLVSCGLLTKSNFESLRPGDTEQEVLAKLGKPDVRTFDRGVTIWQYVTLSKDVWELDFEDGRLVRLDKQRDVARRRGAADLSRPYYRSYPSESPVSWLSSLLAQLDNAFPRDQKVLVERAASMHYFMPEEAAQVIEKFSFKSDRLEVLRMLVPALVHFDDLSPLYELFSFSDERREIDRLAAQEIQQRRRRSPYR